MSTYSDYWTGTEYEDELLPKAQDVAYQVSNNAWRMPTKDQFDALRDNTSFERVSDWTSIGNSNGGYFLTSNKNRLSLFLAAAGGYNDGSLSTQGDNGFYWSSTPLSDTGIWYLEFDNENIATDYTFYRRFGFLVRPVKNK